MENKEREMSVREKGKGFFPRLRSKLKPFASLGRKIVGEDIRVFWSRVLFLLGPLIALFQVELLNETNLYYNLDPGEFIMNMVWYCIVFFIFWLILGRRRRTAVVSCIFFEVIGIVNHYVLEFRGRILFPHDIASVRTAANVVGEYDFTPDYYIYGTMALMLLYFLAVKFWMVPQKERSYFRKKYVTGLLGVAAAGYIVAFFFTGWLPSQGIKTQQWRTQSNGFVLNFTIALRYSSVDKPSDYSEENMTKLTQSLTAEYDAEEESGMDLYADTFQATKKAGTTPVGGDTVTKTQPTNLICIMNESFTDMSIYDKRIALAYGAFLLG